MGGQLGHYEARLKHGPEFWAGVEMFVSSLLLIQLVVGVQVQMFSEDGGSSFC
jgi:hypothetical protein